MRLIKKLRLFSYLAYFFVDYIINNEIRRSVSIVIRYFLLNDHHINDDKLQLQGMGYSSTS